MPVTVALTPHPDTPCPILASLDVILAWRPDGGLDLRYSLTGDLAALRLPAPADPVRRDGLWRHTCFEAFVMAGDGPAYREFNFAPSGQWAAYAFAGYRAGGHDLAMARPEIACQVAADRLLLSAHLPASALPAGMLRLGLSAVIEAAAGPISYWALRHAPGRPDFHHTDAFALTLPRP